MVRLQTKVSAEEAISFLISRLKEQAQADSVALSQMELKQLSFSEEAASDSEITAAAEFDANHDTALFEAKIAKLLRSAFSHDMERSNRAIWDMNLEALAERDVYVLVMVDQAGIPRTKSRFLKGAISKPPQQLIPLLHPALIWAMVLAGTLYFVILPLNSSKQAASSYVFGSLVDRLQMRDDLKGELFLVWIAASIFALYFPPKSR